MRRVQGRRANRGAGISRSARQGARRAGGTRARRGTAGIEGSAAEERGLRDLAWLAVEVRGARRHPHPVGTIVAQPKERQSRQPTSPAEKRGRRGNQTRAFEDIQAFASTKSITTRL